MRGVVPCRGDVRELGDRGEDHNPCRNRTAERSRAPSQRRRRVTVDSVDRRGVVCSVEEVESDVHDPDAVEVHQKMREGPSLVERLEEDAIPLDAVELHEALCRGKVDQTTLFDI